MTSGGFAGNVLHVDLTRGVVNATPTETRLAQKFIGGLGLTLKLAYDTITPGVEALAPENPIVLGAGPLVGTDLPSTSRIYTVSKLPTSGTIGWCGAGGVNFGYLLKNAGYDHVVIEGRAARPVFLKITLPENNWITRKLSKWCKIILRNGVGTKRPASRPMKPFRKWV